MDSGQGLAGMTAIRNWRDHEEAFHKKVSGTLLVIRFGMNSGGRQRPRVLPLGLAFRQAPDHWSRGLRGEMAEKLITMFHGFSAICRSRVIVSQIILGSQPPEERLGGSAGQPLPDGHRDPSPN